jgi:penicillin-binding protein 2
MLKSHVHIRIRWLTALFPALLFVLAIRLFNLQVVNYNTYAEKAHANRTRYVRDRAPRGRIVDRNGVLLAATKPSFSLYITPEDFPDDRRSQVYDRLSKIVNISSETIRKRYSETLTAPFRPRKIMGNLSQQQVVRIETNRYHLPGVSIAAEYVRAYPFSRTLCHVLGYVGEISESELQSDAFSEYRMGDVIGKSGLERALERVLNGRDGYRWVEVDATGRQGFTLRYPQPVRAVPGSEVQLTVNLELQRACETFLDPWKGSIVVMDPRNGDILAMVSRPEFDPNLFATGVTATEWESIANCPDNPLLNRAIQFEAPPGSVFKIITAIAALQKQEIDRNTTWFCSGEFNFSKNRFHCWHRPGHGNVNLINAMENSCNVYFYQAGLKTGIDWIAETARDFGLGSRTGIQLSGEKPGLIPDRNWKRRVFNDDWWPGETISVSIGQGSVLVTPLQVAEMMSKVANRGLLYQPRLVSGYTGQMSRDTVIFEPEIKSSINDFENWDTVIDSLERVVAGSRGTARRVRMREMTLAGKTGTAQVISFSALQRMGYTPEDETEPRFRSHSWFAGFGPVDNPEVVIVVLIENAGKIGSREKFTITRQVLHKWYELTKPGFFGPEPEGKDQRHVN